MLTYAMYMLTHAIYIYAQVSIQTHSKASPRKDVLKMLTYAMYMLTYADADVCYVRMCSKC